MSGKRMGLTKQQKMLRLQLCEDPNSAQYRQHRWAQWGDDPRYKRCSRCGAISAEGISNEARYPRERQQERPIRHYHQFALCHFDPRYERCRCGATNTAQKPIEAQKANPRLTRIVHVRRDAFDIYVGRRVRSRPDLVPLGFGNPFTSRNLPRGYDNAVDAFHDWLMGKPNLAEAYREQRAVMLTQLGELRGLRLGCWCAPKGGIGGDLYGHTCHGEVLAALADQLISAVDVAVDVGEKRGEGVSCERA